MCQGFHLSNGHSEMANCIMETIMQTKDDYIKQLKGSTGCNLVATTLFEYINAIAAINHLYGKTYYRGMANENWEIESSAYRVVSPKTPKHLQEHHQRLLREVQKMRDVEQHSPVHMLAHLQHHGAKTILIDYSLNPLVALWFACLADKSSAEECDGAVHCFTREYKKVIQVDDDISLEALFQNNEAFYEFSPPFLNRRIISQQAVFVFRADGKNDKGDHIRVSIPSDNKNEILKNLKTLGIAKKTLFPDFYGFLEWFDTNENELEANKDRMEMYVAEGDILNQKLEFIRAIGQYHEAIKIGEQLVDPDSLYMSSIYNKIATAYLSCGDYHKSIEYYEKSLEVCNSVLNPEHPHIAAVYSDMAGIYRELGLYPKATAFYEKALSTYMQYGENNLAIALIYNNMANLKSIQCDYEKSMELNKKAMEICEKFLAQHNRETQKTCRLLMSDIYNSIAGIYQWQKKHSEALELSKKCLIIKEEFFPPNHPEIGVVCNNLGSIYTKLGMYNQAITMLERALSIQKHVLNSDTHPIFADIYINMAGVYINQGKSELALAMCENALGIYKQFHQVENIPLAHIYLNIALVHESLENYPSALDHYLKSLAIYDKVLGRSHEETKPIPEHLQRCYEKTDKTQDFDEWLREMCEKQNG